MFEDSTSAGPPTASGIAPPRPDCGSAHQASSSVLSPRAPLLVCPMPSLDEKGRHRDAEGRAMAMTQAAARGAVKPSSAAAPVLKQVPRPRVGVAL